MDIVGCNLIATEDFVCSWTKASSLLGCWFKFGCKAKACTFKQQSHFIILLKAWFKFKIYSNCRLTCYISIEPHKHDAISLLLNKIHRSHYIILTHFLQWDLPPIPFFPVVLNITSFKNLKSTSSNKITFKEVINCFNKLFIEATQVILFYFFSNYEVVNFFLIASHVMELCLETISSFWMREAHFYSSQPSQLVL